MLGNLRRRGWWRFDQAANVQLPLHKQATRLQLDRATQLAYDDADTCTTDERLDNDVSVDHAGLPQYVLRHDVRHQSVQQAAHRLHVVRMRGNIKCLFDAGNSS